jgi:pimeloyl-ACP methyl ester carboxylesterase
VQISLGPLVFDVTVSGPEDAPAVLLLHGFPQTSHCWRRLLPYLQGRRLVLPEQRGYSPGARPPDVEDYRLPRMVEDALGILDALGIEQADVVGHDFGAAVTWQLAARHPARVRTATALSVPHPLAMIGALRADPDQRSRSGYMRTFAQPGYDELLLADDAALLRAFFTEAVDVEPILAAARQPGALASWLKWYPGQRLEDLGDTPVVTCPPCTCGPTGTPLLAPSRRTTRHSSSPGRTGWRSSKPSPTGSRKRRPTGSGRSCGSTSGSERSTRERALRCHLAHHREGRHLRGL